MPRALLRLGVVLWLAGCGAQPAPEFFGAERQEIVDGAQRYVLFRRGARFEVIRLGAYLPRGPRQEEVRNRMLLHVEQATGCRLIARSLIGDVGEMRGTLDC